MQTADVLTLATDRLLTLAGHEFDVLTVSKPISPDAAVFLSRVVSKLSPLLGNMIEFNTVEFLNLQKEFEGHGEWERQDPGFPDVVFRGVDPLPGYEIKAWFPMATEITGRFKDSQNHFVTDNTYDALLAWLPEHLIYGKPRIVDVCVVSGASVAKSRDEHYHNPPHYIVLEPEDTSERTRNLQQTNTNGYVFQGTPDEFQEAVKFVSAWGEEAKTYSTAPEYQSKLRDLQGKFKYRLDTNYAKIDRIVHPQIEQFKSQVLMTKLHGMTIRQWAVLLNRGSDEAVRKALADHLNIKEGDVDDLLE